MDNEYLNRRNFIAALAASVVAAKAPLPTGFPTELPIPVRRAVNSQSWEVHFKWDKDKQELDFGTWRRVA